MQERERERRVAGDIARERGRGLASIANDFPQTAFYVFAGVVPTSMLFYSISRPGANGEPSSISQWLRGFEAMNKDWETINAMRTDALDQAAHDRHLFAYSNSRAAQGPTVVLKAPEYVFVSVPFDLCHRLWPW